MKQNLRVLLNRSSIYLAMTFPYPLFIVLMCRLNELPYGCSASAGTLAGESDEPSDRA
jgi:hypothetical protein